VTHFSGARNVDRDYNMDPEHTHVADADSKCQACAYMSWPESTKSLALAMCDVIWHEEAGDMADDIVQGLEYLGYRIVPK
jgi:hypothetical protein